MQELPETMKAVVTSGVGGYDRLEYRDVAVPEPGAGEVLLRVLAAGVNNTEINTRLGWYSSAVRVGTEGAASGEPHTDGGWDEETPFPLIQGTDCCGRIAGVGPGGDKASIGRRVIVRACMRPEGFDSLKTVWLGSDFDGAFAQYVKIPAAEAFEVDCGWSDAELASIPCAYGTAENMVERAGISVGTRVLVSGASGGVGSAVVQLAKRRGAEVTAIASARKHALVRDLGVSRILAREDNPLETLGAESMDVVIDNVAGPAFGTMIKVLQRGGRYVSSGAIAGPIVELDLRDIYLKTSS